MWRPIFYGPLLHVQIMVRKKVNEQHHYITLWMKILLKNTNLKTKQVIRITRFQIFTANTINIKDFVHFCRWLLSLWRKLLPPSSGWNPEDHNLKATRNFLLITILCNYKIRRYLVVILMLQLVTENWSKNDSDCGEMSIFPLTLCFKLVWRFSPQQQ